MHIRLHNSAHVQGFDKHLLSPLSAVAGKALLSRGSSKDIHVDDVDMLFTRTGKRCLLCINLHHRPPSCPIVNREVVSPVFTPDEEIDTDHFHVSYSHLNKNLLLHDIAEQLGATLTGELQPSNGCSIGKKGLRKAIPSSTAFGAKRKLQRVFVDLSGKKSVVSIFASHYTMIARDEYGRYIWLLFFKHESDVATKFENSFGNVA